jgi:hypothetical protein
MFEIIKNYINTYPTLKIILSMGLVLAVGLMAMKLGEGLGKLLWIIIHRSI